MGDTLEIVTNEVEVTSGFYKITSGALSFEIKGYGPAFVGFAKTPSLDVYYWVGIDNNRRSIIEVSDPRRIDRNRAEWVVSPNVEYSLDANLYKKYWVLWDCKLLQVGDGIDVCKPTITKPITQRLNYVVFMSDGSCQWKIEMPPAALIQMTKPMPPKSIEGGIPQWVRTGGQLPEESIIGGYENGETLYIIRGPHRGSLTPGKFVPSEGVSYISWGGESHVMDDFEVLCGYNIEWVPTHNCQIPTNAFIGGHTENGEALYIGRVHHNGNLFLGKVQAGHKLCYFPYKGKEIGLSDFEILSVPNLKSYVLCGYNIEWVPTLSCQIPTNAFVGGHSENREVLYIGRVHHNGNLILGKVQPTHKVCYFPYEDKEVASEEFEILTVPNQRSYITHDKFFSNLTRRLLY